MHRYLFDYLKYKILTRNEEVVFGDLVFDGGTKYFNIPLRRALKRKLTAIGFEITFSDKKSNIRKRDNLLESLDSQYYICQK